MRRRRRQSQKPLKLFDNSFHLNEVPLPFYNPLADPYLSGYFSNKKIIKLIKKEGLVYRPNKQYPYQQRRTINSHKFLRSNSCYVPTHNLLQSQISSSRRKSMQSSYYLKQNELTRSEQTNKKQSGHFGFSPRKILRLKEVPAEAPQLSKLRRPRSFSFRDKHNEFIFSNYTNPKIKISARPQNP